MISKELLSEVLGVKVLTEIINDDLKDNILCYWEFDGYANNCRNINIYELSDKIIDWIQSQEYYILNKEMNIYRLYAKENEVYSIDTKTRIDVAFMCGQWILDNKKEGN